LQMNSFVDYLEERYSFRMVSGGSQFQLAEGPCPFCGRASNGDLRLYINPKRGLGDCKHCGQAFNAVQFVAAAEKMSYHAAKLFLLEGDGYVRTQQEDAPDIQTPVPHNAISALESDAAKNYLNGRGISDKLIEEYGVLFCPDH